MFVNGFDIDGVIHLGNGVCGIRPGPQDVIITGRSFEEEAETLAFLRKHGINNIVFFNPAAFDKKSRKSSGHHKGKTISSLYRLGVKIRYFYEDDEIQMAEIKEAIERSNLDTRVIKIDNPYVEKENKRHLEDLA
jgi:hypothetical protein